MTQVPSVSFVLPCLNEQETLPIVLKKINQVRQTVFQDRQTEVVVSDNGSTDDSVAIAQAHGARVVHCPERGYGAALQFGIENAAHDVVVFADADNTYDFLEAPQLVEALEEGYDLVFGSRLDGTIHDGAMPRLHRYLGTPTLNFFINLLYARDGNKISDCNSGFRCLRREVYLSWAVKGRGMEYASEMLVKALKARAKISQVPISLYPDVEGRQPHLKTWRDGMRHLLQIFSESPLFFFVTGSTVWGVSWLIFLVSFFWGPLSLGIASVFGVHTMMFALLGALFGLTVWGIGLFLATRQDTSIKLYRFLIDVSEDKLFWYTLLFALVNVVLLLSIVVKWGLQGFRNIALEKETLGLIMIGANGLLLVSHVISAHLIKRI